jgi:hypothetical protein
MAKSSFPQVHKGSLKGLSVFCLLVCVFLITSCAAQVATSVPTATESAIVASATLAVATSVPVQSTPTSRDLPKTTPIIIPQPTTPTPEEVLPTLDKKEFPTGQIILLSPGAGSRIVSPLRITAFAHPGSKGKITLQLYGEDGRLMGEQLVRLGTEDKWITFESKIPFEITSAGENAILTLTTFDSDSRRIAVNSAKVELLQVGDTITEANQLTKLPIVITTPKEDKPVSGGNLHIDGFAVPYSSAPLILGLFKANGAIVASKQIALKPLNPGDIYVPFSVDLPYTVSESTPVRISIRQANDAAPLIDLVLVSQLNTLKP